MILNPFDLFSLATFCLRIFSNFCNSSEMLWENTFDNPYTGTSEVARLQVITLALNMPLRVKAGSETEACKTFLEGHRV